MSSQHNKPFIAFAALALLAAVVLGNQFRSNASGSSHIAAGSVAAHSAVRHAPLPTESAASGSVARWPAGGDHTHVLERTDRLPLAAAFNDGNANDGNVKDTDTADAVAEPGSGRTVTAGSPHRAPASGETQKQLATRDGVAGVSTTRERRALRDNRASGRQRADQRADGRRSGEKPAPGTKDRVAPDEEPTGPTALAVRLKKLKKDPGVIRNARGHVGGKPESAAGGPEKPNSDAGGQGSNGPVDAPTLSTGATDTGGVSQPEAPGDSVPSASESPGNPLG